MLENGISRDGVVVMRMEDLVATSGSGQTLRELVAVFDLPADPSAASCLASASASIEHPPRVYSSVPTSPRTLSNHYLLNGTVASVQNALLSTSFLSHSTSFVPFTLAQLIAPDVFAAFRRVVDTTALAIDGSDWTTYCDEVHVQLSRTWKVSAGGIPGGGVGPLGPRPAASRLLGGGGGGAPSAAAPNLEAEVQKVQGELNKLEARGAGWESSQTANRARARLVALRQQLRGMAASQQPQQQLV
jgi:hypothetical protein